MIKTFVCVLLSIMLCLGCTPKTEINTPNDNTLNVNDDNKDSKLIIPKDNIYYNDSADYRIAFPENYTGWFGIFEHNNSDSERITVYFTGKSDYVKNFCEENGVPGLELFSISNKQDNSGIYQNSELGMARNIKYYIHKPVVLNDVNIPEQDKTKYTNLFNETDTIERLFAGFGNQKINPDDKGTYLSDVKGKYTAPDLPTDNVYVNKQCGYRLTFPKSWTGWYYIADDINPEAVSVYFYGKSMTGSFYMPHISEYFGESMPYGIYMFSIISEKELDNGFYDSVTKVGTANGINYYYATGTDAPLSILYSSHDCWNDITREELELAEKDGKKAQQMNHNDVIKTFEEYV